MQILKNSMIFSRMSLLALSTFFGVFFQNAFLGVIALWYMIMIVLEKVTGLKYTPAFETTLLLFIILSSYLGTAWGMYDVFWWWDKMLHFLYGFCFAFIGFKIIESVFRHKGMKDQLFIILTFSFCFSIAIGAIWEILEYFFDIFGVYLYGDDWSPLVQTSPGFDAINDTMQDIIIETLSALILNIMLYVYYKFGIFTFFHNIEIFVLEKRKIIEEKVRESTKKLEQQVKEKTRKIEEKMKENSKKIEEKFKKNRENFRKNLQTQLGKASRKFRKFKKHRK